MWWYNRLAKYIQFIAGSLLNRLLCCGLLYLLYGLLIRSETSTKVAIEIASRFTRLSTRSIHATVCSISDAVAHTHKYEVTR